MIESFSCFTSSCKKQVNFVCGCTLPETMMCKIHKINHLKGPKAHHKIRNFLPEDHKVLTNEDVFKTLNSEKLWMEKIKNILTANFNQSMQDIIRLKLIHLEESIVEIDKLIKAFKKISNIQSRVSGEEIIQRQVYKNKDQLADLILNEKKAQLDTYQQNFMRSSSNSKSIYNSQLLQELHQFFTFDEYEIYIFSIVTPSSHIKKSYKNFIKECENFYSLLEKPTLKVLKNNSHTLFNTNSNYLYSYDDNYDGIELYYYDIEFHNISRSSIKYKRFNYFLLNDITNIIKISKSSLLVIGNSDTRVKGFIMDLRSKLSRQIFDNRTKVRPFDMLNQSVYYENYIYIFGSRNIQSCMKMSLNSKILQQINFPSLKSRIWSVLFKNYVLISNYSTSHLYLFDLLIEDYSEISYFGNMQNNKLLFADNLRVYIWAGGSIFESEENNPFKWNAISNFHFPIHTEPSEITHSNYMGNLYIGFHIRSQMYCFKFRREKKEMELIFQEDVNK